MTLALLLALTASSTAAAPGAIRLPEAIRIAHEQTRGMIHARANLVVADVERMQALARVLPSLTFSLGAQEHFWGSPMVESRSAGALGDDCHGPEDTREDLPACYGYGPFSDYRYDNASHPWFTATITARQLLFDGGRWWAQIARADDRRAIMDANLQVIRDNVRLGVVARFYGLAKAARAVQTFEKQVALTRAQLERARARLAEGKGKEDEVATAERNLASDRVTLARRVFSRASQARALNIVMGRAADTPVSVVLSPEVESGAPVNLKGLPRVEAFVAAAVAERPSVLVQRASLETVRENLEMQKAAYWPTASLAASYSRGSRRPDRIFADPTDNYRATLGLDVSWSLFSGGATDAAVRRAEVDVEKTIATLVDHERRVTSEVIESMQRLELLVEVFRLALAGAQSAAEAVRLARVQYDQGNSTALELRDAELRQTQARLSSINARLDIEVAREQLRRAVGVSVFDGIVAERKGR